MAANDFGRGPMWRRILAQAVPLTVAQLVQLLYNVVDRVYIGHMDDSMALTGVGLAFPVVTLILAFTALFGAGGVPLFSMARGAGEPERAERILGNSCALLLGSALVLTAAGYLFCRPILFAFGASPDSYGYAREYLNIYLAGTVFSMLSTGLNGYINAQGFPKIGMCSIVIGAVTNIALDPVFIFGFEMGVAGAALATVLSQAVSALWVLRFLLRGKIPVPLKFRSIRADWQTTAQILRLGTANFIMQGTNCLVQVACNTTLQTFGGDLYVGIMTVTNSVREIFMLPVSGIVGGAQPVISYNYGAGKLARVKEAFYCQFGICVGYATVFWLVMMLFPNLFAGMFTNNTELVDYVAWAIRIYMACGFSIGFQRSCQQAFVALGQAKISLVMALLRKVILLIPLIFILPHFFADKAFAVFLAEPVADIAAAAVTTFMFFRFFIKMLKGAEKE